MKMIIIWCKNNVSLIKYIVVIVIGLLFCWLLNLSVGLEAVKAFGPVIASGFLGWVAYNQFKLARSQKEIYQQQADIAQRKVELDIRDRRYEVFKRWNEAYFIFKDQAHNNIPKDQFVEAKNTFIMTSDEMFYIFNKSLVADMVPAIKQEIQNIELYRNEWLKEANKYVWEESGWRWGDPGPTQVEHGFNQFIWCERMRDYDYKIENRLDEIHTKRKKLIVQALQEMKIS